jgi:hypothetical protein
MRSLLLLWSLLLAGCTTGWMITYPMVGKLSDGSTARGNLWVDVMFGVGTFEWLTVYGLRCTGDFDALDSRPTITIPVTCNDGQSGTVIATSNTSRVIEASFAGTADARLENGLTGRFIFGNVTAKEQAEFLD